MKRFSFCLLIISMSIFSLQDVFAQTITNTVLVADYENGTTNSGISGIDPTHATAPDAVFMSSGYLSTFGVGHTIKMGNSAYNSDGAYRSESSTIDAYQFFPGDEHRYEFSVNMRDWPSWTDGVDPLYGVVLFQLKMSDGVGEPLRVIAQRNYIESRRDVRDAGGNNVSAGQKLVNNFRPYVNGWIHFRIDVKWTTDATGYIKIYVKTPDDADYVLKDEQYNIVTFISQSAGNIGYLKWGVYTAAGNPGGTLENNDKLVFTAHHDNIRVFELNGNSATKPSIWSNNVDNGSSTITLPLTTGNKTVFNVQNDGNTGSPVFAIGASGGGLTQNSVYSTRVNVNNWTKPIGGTPSPLNPDQYFEFKMSVTSGSVKMDSLVFTATRGQAQAPNTFVLRSSLDGFNSDIGSGPQTFDGTGSAGTRITYKFAVSGLATAAVLTDNIQGPVTFRMYWYGNTSTGTVGVGINDFAFYGSSNVVLPVNFGALAAIYKNGQLFVNWSTESETNNHHFEVEASEDGVAFHKIGTAVSKATDGNSSQKLDYEFSVTSAASLGAPAVLLLLFAGFKNRRNKWVMALALAGVCFVVACSKRDAAFAAQGKNLFIRIKQVDIDGSFKYSKTVKVVNE